VLGIPPLRASLSNHHIMSATTGANGDYTSSNTVSNHRVDHEEGPASAFNDAEPNLSTGTSITSMFSGQSGAETTAHGDHGAKWRAPEGRGGAFIIL
jgi:hypothetical protein